MEKPNLRKMEEEFREGKHRIINPNIPKRNLYDFNDFEMFQGINSHNLFYSAIESLEELLEREEQRKKDGFHPKIRIGRIIKPGKDGKIVVVPVADEEKFYHNPDFDNPLREEMMQIISQQRKYNSLKAEDRFEDLGDGIGSGKGKRGKIIYERSLEGEGEGEGQQAGDEEGDHEIESNAYEVGKILTEKWKLPNIQKKRKKKSLTKYKYELTNKNQGEGQVLDKKSTLDEIIRTNIGLGIIKEGEEIDPTKLLISKNDHVYRTLSKEKDYESQALVFFLRDYSGSMHGEPTELVTSQHLLIYAWLAYQYKNNVSSRFIVHDTKAKELPNFHQYYNASVAGGTDISSGFRLINKIVREEDLARDYNIYTFYGGDGGDWEDGDRTLDEIEEMITYTNRIGISIAKDHSVDYGPSDFEEYIHMSGILDSYKKLIKMDVIAQNANEKRIIKGIRRIIS